MLLMHHHTLLHHLSRSVNTRRSDSGSRPVLALLLLAGGERRPSSPFLQTRIDSCCSPSPGFVCNKKNNYKSFLFIRPDFINANPPTGGVIYNKWPGCHCRLPLRWQHSHLTQRSMAALSARRHSNRWTFPVRLRPCCLSAHSAMRGLLRRKRENSPLTPERPTFSNKQDL